MNFLANSTKARVVVPLVTILTIVLVAVLLWRRPQSDVIRIGVLLPLSGENAVYGSSLQKGMRLAKAGIGADPKFDLLYRDSKADPATGVRAATQLATLDDVHLLIGGMFSSVTLAVAPVAAEHHLTLVSPTSSAVEISTLKPHIFRIYPSDSSDGQFLSKFARDSLQAKRAAVLYMRVSSTTAISEVFNNNFAALGGQVVLNEGHNEGEEDFRSALVRVKALAPDVLFVPSYLTETVRILRQSYELGLDMQVITISTFYDPKALSLAGAAAEGVLFSSPVFDVGSSEPMTATFVAAFRSTYSADPDIWAAYGYDVVRVVHHALSHVGRPFSDKGFRDQLAGTKEFPGVTGAITFDDRGDVVKPLRVFVVKDGRFQPWSPASK